MCSNKILYASELEKGIFGEGNVGFESFEEEHECNLFCQYFGLEPFASAQINSQPSKISVESSSKDSEGLPETPITPEELHEMRLHKGKGRETTPIEEGEIVDSERPQTVIMG